MLHRKWFGLTSLLFLVGVGGCGGAKLYPVEGKIVYSDDQAAVELAGGSVEFDPVEGKQGARGQIQTDGGFRMGTLKSEDGVVPGSYRVCIQPPLPDLDRPVQQLLPRRYEDFNTSGLQVTIKAEKNALTLTVERDKPKQ